MGVRSSALAALRRILPEINTKQLKARNIYPPGALEVACGLHSWPEDIQASAFAKQAFLGTWAGAVDCYSTAAAVAGHDTHSAVNCTDSAAEHSTVPQTRPSHFQASAAPD